MPSLKNKYCGQEQKTFFDLNLGRNHDGYPNSNFFSGEFTIILIVKCSFKIVPIKSYILTFLAKQNSYHG